MTRRMRDALMVSAVVVTLVLTPTVAVACQVDNDTGYVAQPFRDKYPASGAGYDQPFGGQTMYVWFSCGNTCGNYWKIESGSSVGRHGAAGYVQACADGAQESTEFYREQGHTYVASGGEAKLHFAWGKDPDGSIGPENHVVVWDIIDGDDKYTGSDQNNLSLVDHDGTGHWCWLGLP